jgi:hypothetical protein
LWLLLPTWLDDVSGDPFSATYKKEQCPAGQWLSNWWTMRWASALTLTTEACFMPTTFLQNIRGTELLNKN